MKIFKSVFVIFAMAVLAIGATGAQFSDTEKVLGNTFAAGTLDLQVGDTNPTTWSFGGDNLAPGDVVRNVTAKVKNLGTIDGDLSMDIDVSDSNDGDLEEQMELRFYIKEDASAPDGYVNTGLVGYISALDGTTFNFSPEHNSWINDETTDTRIRFNATFKDDAGKSFDNNDAMGDTFDLDLTFHLIQS
jgi:predicted ribosomally synthesized peptide with SipW-like signal peptide